MTNDSSPPPRKGERMSPHWTYQFVDLTRIEKGEFIAPGKIDSEAGREFAALNMAKNDLEFASACLSEADKLGMPNSEDVHSRALIFSAVISYARPFKSGVREFKLSKDFFSSLGVGFSSDLHDYLVAIRDKHAAHSVNEFERCEATTVMVGTPDQKVWRVAGIGFTAINAIGLSQTIVEQAVSQISNMLGVLTGEIAQKGKELYEAQRAQFARDGKWEPAPIATFPSRENASKRRV